MLVQFVRLVLGLFGLGGPKIEAARPDGKMPWSTTVVNINRQRNKRNNRIKLLAVVVICLGACFACSTYAWLNSRQKPAQALSAITPTTDAITKPIPPKPTILPTHTPRPPTPTVPRPMIEITATTAVTHGVVGTVVGISVQANDNGTCTIWWDNAIPLARTQTVGGKVDLAIGIPQGGAGSHLIIVEVSNGYSLDRVVIPFTVE